jgi:hypothetical protein
LDWNGKRGDVVQWGMTTTRGRLREREGKRGESIPHQTLSCIMTFMASSVFNPRQPKQNQLDHDPPLPAHAASNLLHSHASFANQPRGENLFCSLWHSYVRRRDLHPILRHIPPAPDAQYNRGRRARQRVRESESDSEVC